MKKLTKKQKQMIYRKAALINENSEHRDRLLYKRHVSPYYLGFCLIAAEMCN